MKLKDQIRTALGEVEPLTDTEYWAVYEWINAEKDGLPSPLKEGLLKLVNAEMHRRM